MLLATLKNIPCLACWLFFTEVKSDTYWFGGPKLHAQFKTSKPANHLCAFAICANVLECVCVCVLCISSLFVSPLCTKVCTEVKKGQSFLSTRLQSRFVCLLTDTHTTHPRIPLFFIYFFFQLLPWHWLVQLIKKTLMGAISLLIAFEFCTISSCRKQEAVAFVYM